MQNSKWGVGGVGLYVFFSVKIAIKSEHLLRLAHGAEEILDAIYSLPSTYTTKKSIGVYMERQGWRPQALIGIRAPARWV